MPRAAAAERPRIGAYREAAAQYARALRFADEPPAEERATLLEHQSDAYYITDDQVMAIEVLRAGDRMPPAGRRDAGTRRAALSRLVPY